MTKLCPVNGKARWLAGLANLAASGPTGSVVTTGTMFKGGVVIQ